MKILYSFLLLSLFLTGCSKREEESRKVKFYQSPMHPWITSDKPGNCTICGMKLVPVFEGEKGIGAEKNDILLSSDSINVLGVTVVHVRRMELTKSARFSGILEDDENAHRVIAAYYDGRIDRIAVLHVGEYLKKGQPMASIYSPELLYVVREYQNSMKMRDEGLARKSAQRLIQFGLDADQVASLVKQSDDIFTIDLLAPISGTVLTKQAYQGQYIKTGEPLFEMGDLSRLWFHAEVYERDLPDLRIGQKAVLRTPTVPDREFEGTVTFIDPNFDDKTRTTKVRIEVDNPLSSGDGLRRLLPHKAYAEADVTARLGEALVIPHSAILRDGRRSVVYVEMSAGHYEQRSVKAGRRGDEGIEILEGLKEGDRVVTQGNLMIDAEAQLRQGTATQKDPAPTTALSSAKSETFLIQLAKVSSALAADDAVAAVKEGQDFQSLAGMISRTQDPKFDALVQEVQTLRETPKGSDLKAVRQAFLPWSQLGAAMALMLQKGEAKMAIRVFECPMTGQSFPGAPAQARWVQSGIEVRNPYLGIEMLNCGSEVRQ